MRSLLIALFALIILAPATVFAQNSDILPTDKGPLAIQPIVHASLVLSLSSLTIYIDPTGGAANYKGIKSPDLIFITDIHGDHFEPATLGAVVTPSTKIVAPKAVADLMPDSLKAITVIMHNGDKTVLSRHPPGRGNGYVLSIGGKNIYLSGDTQGIPEMRALKNIDVAFVCMNLPYTMDINEAADAVLAFKPRIVYPYHYRGQGGLSDIAAFKAKVEAGDKNIEVRLRNWYPAKP
jgi:L-ascorbate metabolism protein UlaG (beta-lactamase superfamily)